MNEIETGMIIFPVPLQDGRFAKLYIPGDLTKEEAELTP